MYEKYYEKGRIVKKVPDKRARVRTKASISAATESASKSDPSQLELPAPSIFLSLVARYASGKSALS